MHLAILASRAGWRSAPPSRTCSAPASSCGMGDPIDSDIGRKCGRTGPGRPARPRASTPERLHLLIGLPRLDSSSDVEDLPAGVAGACEAVRAASTATGRRRGCGCCRTTSTATQSSTLPDEAGSWSKAKVAIGINEAELAPVVRGFRRATAPGRLRRRRMRQDRAAAQHRRPGLMENAHTDRVPRSSWSTSGGPCWVSSTTTISAATPPPRSRALS